MSLHYATSVRELGFCMLEPLSCPCPVLGLCTICQVGDLVRFPVRNELSPPAVSQAIHAVSTAPGNVTLRSMLAHKQSKSQGPRRASLSIRTRSLRKFPSHSCCISSHLWSREIGRNQSRALRSESVCSSGVGVSLGRIATMMCLVKRPCQGFCLNGRGNRDVSTYEAFRN